MSEDSLLNQAIRQVDLFDYEVISKVEEFLDEEGLLHKFISRIKGEHLDTVRKDWVESFVYRVCDDWYEVFEDITGQPCYGKIPKNDDIRKVVREYAERAVLNIVPKDYENEKS